MAVIDEGMRWCDPVFWDSFGNSLLQVWDQTDPRGPAPELMGMPYGTAVDASTVKRLCAGRTSGASRAGHGGRMALIAAGRVGHGTELGELFTDQQSNVSVLLVNTTGKQAEVLDALEYVKRRSRELGARFVINLSMSLQAGPHDGTDLFTRAIDSIVDDSGLLVVSIGNEGNQKHYMRKAIVGRASIPIEIRQKECRAGTFTKFQLEGWYRPTMRLQFSVGSPQATGVRWVSEGTVDGIQWPSGRALVDARLVSTSQAMRGLHISAEVPCSQHGATQWNMSVLNTSATAGEFEVWVPQAEGCEVVFPDSPDLLQPISSLAASLKAISVGAYLLRPNLAAVPASFSSAGRTGDGRWKPDLLLAEGLPDKNIPEGGAGATSAAAAVATRCIAHLWSKSPQLGGDVIRRRLAGKVLLPSNPGFVWKGSTQYRAVRLTELAAALGRSAGSSKE